MICRVTGRLDAIEGTQAVVTPPPGAVSHEVLLPAYVAERLAGRVGAQVTLVTLEYLEAQGQGTSFIPRLVGFESARERDFFLLFTTVKGIGNKKALRAMASPPAEIAGAIASKDSRWLSRLPEIGKRLSETIVAELTGRVAAYMVFDEMDAAGGAGGGASGADGDAAGAVGADGAGGAGVDGAGVGGAGGASGAGVEVKPGAAGGLSGRAAAIAAEEDAIDALVALGESRGDAERLVSKAVAALREATRAARGGNGVTAGAASGAGASAGTRGGAGAKNAKTDRAEITSAAIVAWVYARGGVR
jgi:Holliday junction DNA helicase RuvA